MGSARVTTFDVARESKLSRSTVCNILNPKRALMYSEKTRNRVLKKAEELGYQNSLLASAIREPLRHIAFAASGFASLNSAFMTQILHGVHNEAARHGYLVMVSGSSLNTPEVTNCEMDTTDLDLRGNELTTKLISLVSAKVIDGILIDKSRFGDAQMELLKSQNIPSVLINGLVPTPFFVDDSLDKQKPIFRKMYWVSIDHEEGGRFATEYLIGYGHRCIGLLTPSISQVPMGYRPNMIFDRIKGYKAAIKDAGINIRPELIVEGSLTDKTTVLTAIDKLIRLQQPPTAIFVADDEMAVLAINYLRERGLKVPADISIIGYGNLPICYSVVPNLTTVDVPWANMGEMGLRILISLLNGKAPDNHNNVLRVKLLEGASVAAPQKR